MRAPPDAETMIRGLRSLMDLSMARVSISPTTEPIEPPIKRYSMADIWTGRPPIVPRAFTSASFNPVDF